MHSSLKTVWIAFALAVPCPGGEVRHVQQTPSELAALGIDFEKAEFAFAEPVLGSFWIESQPDPAQAAKRYAVSRDGVLPSARFVLSYVDTAQGLLQLSVTTDPSNPLANRAFTLGPDPQPGSRSIRFAPEKQAVGLDQDLVVFEIQIKPSWRRPNDPIRRYRLIARFSKPAAKPGGAGQPAGPAEPEAGHDPQAQPKAQPH
ncbi:hypothetical protein [Haloferula sp. BvORR071]|uniref:hypothetical protein n=1 Tax=Haloferula sp. BvORR071 TaxID=1396141 RepID=UPI0005565919|nr:hypothetical protein [Haloferula sp. BvORR071]